MVGNSSMVLMSKSLSYHYDGTLGGGETVGKKSTAECHMSHNFWVLDHADFLTIFSVTEKKLLTPKNRT